MLEGHKACDHPHKAENIETGESAFQDAEGFWMDERDVCNHCREQREADKKPFAFGDTRTSFGYYAGKYCESCWANSGYRDATDPDAEFDEADCGESLHGDPVERWEAELDF